MGHTPSPRFMNARFCFVMIAYGFEYCAIIGFMAVYLLNYGFSYFTIGLVIAVANLVSCVLQPLLGDFADRTTRFSLKQMICALCIFGAIVVAVLEITEQPMWILLLYSLCIIIGALVQPLINAWGLAQSKVNFGLARGFFSLAYAVAAAGIGLLIGQMGSSLIDDMMLAFWLLLLLAALLFPATKKVSSSLEAECEHSALVCEKQLTPVTTRQFFSTYRRFCFMLVGAFFLMLAYCGIEVFLIRIAENLGGNSTTMGLCVAISATVELPVMAFYVVMRKRLSCETIIAISSVGFLLKTLAVWMAPTVEVLLLAQLFQAISFALYVPATIEYVKLSVSPADSVKGQALLTATQTLALVLSSAGGGLVIDVFGFGVSMFLWVAASSIGTVVVLALVIRNKASKRELVL